MENLQPYFHRRDDDGHDYYVPEHLIEEFDEWNSLDTDSDEFYEDFHKFSGFMFGKSDHDLKLWINPIDLR